MIALRSQIKAVAPSGGKTVQCSFPVLPLGGNTEPHR